MDMLTQSIELSRTPHIVIATPGRLADHINSGDGLKLKKVKFLVSGNDLELCNVLYNGNILDEFMCKEKLTLWLTLLLKLMTTKHVT